MSIAQHHLQKAVAIIGAYPQKEPLALYVKQALAANKKHGSKDRKNIADAVFSYYRLGYTVNNWQVADAVVVALFLTRTNVGIWEPIIPAVLLPFLGLTPAEKWEVLKEHFPFFDKDNWMPTQHLLSTEIDYTTYCTQLLQQPSTYLRIRPNKAAAVEAALAQQQIPYTVVEPTCLAVAPNTAVQQVLTINKQVVVQDWGSQQVATLFTWLPARYKTMPIQIWDVCAASGGKTLLAIDYFQQAKVFATDVRPQILRNYTTRMQEAGFSQYQTLAVDVSAGNAKVTNRSFQLVMADVPCSGSGTWARTPEQLRICTPEKVESYVELQRKIAQNSLKSVESGGHFLYITCSVFACENEENVQFLLQQNPALKLVKQQYFSHAQHQTDTLFAALFLVP